MQNGAKQIAKAELHCHADGILDAAMLREFAERGMAGHELATALEAVGPISSLDRWVSEYQPVATSFLDPLAERLGLVALAQRERWQRQNVHYAELFVSGILGAIPDGEPLREWFRALALELGADAGVPEVNLLVCISRAKVTRHIEPIVDLAKARLISGVAIAGDELACPVRELQTELRRIREQGVGLEIHVGEVGGPEWVRDALDFGRPDRIGHGVRAFEDAALVERLAKQEIHIEFCPTSNLRLGVVPAIEQLPVRQALALGIPFSINTDDPGVFQCSMTSELELVRQTFSLSTADLELIFRHSMNAAFRSHARAR